MNEIIHRREFFKMAGVAALYGAAAVGGAGSILIHPDVAYAASDADLLNAARGLELEAIAAYNYVSSDPAKVFPDATKALASHFATQHGEHSDALGAAIRSVGSAPVTAPGQTDFVKSIGTKYKAAYGTDLNLEDHASVVKLAILLEYEAVLAYADVAVQLADKGFASTLYTIQPDEAMHVATLRIALALAAQGIGFSDKNVPITDAGLKALGGAVPDAFASAGSKSTWINLQL